MADHIRYDFLTQQALRGVVRSVLGDDAKKGGPPVPDADAMKHWQECCTPNESHAWLSRFLGRWDTVMKVSMGNSVAESKGTAEFRWLMDGRWLAMDAKGEMMGQPITQFCLLGFDNFKKKYVVTYVDSMSTAMLSSEGFTTQDRGTLVCYGPMDEPLTGENDKPVKYVWRFPDAKTIVFELHDLAIGEPNTKVVEVTYRKP